MILTVSRSVWIHDYHLLLVPSMLRIKIPKVCTGLFVHSPWPTSEILRCLPSKYHSYQMRTIDD
jgi:trehalose-6-phosphate synthase